MPSSARDAPPLGYLPPPPPLHNTSGDRHFRLGPRTFLLCFCLFALLQVPAMARVGGLNRRRRRGSSAADALASARASGSAFPSPSPLIPSSSPAANSSISDIRLALTSRLDSLRKDADLMHASLLKEVTTASSRLSKRVKLELQACTQHADEFERDCHAFSSDFKDDMDEIKGDYEDFVSKMHNSTSQYLKKTLPDFMTKVEKDIEMLRVRFVTAS